MVIYGKKVKNKLEKKKIIVNKIRHLIKVPIYFLNVNFFEARYQPPTSC